MKTFFLVVLSAAFFHSGTYQPVQAQPRVPALPREPSPPRPDGYSGDKILGDPENGVRALKHIYRMIQKYRELHEGAFPTGLGGDMKIDLRKNPKLYGFESSEQALVAILNVDAKYNSDSISWNNPKNQTTPALKFVRFNGTASGGPKEAGTSDVWGINRDYFYHNSANVGMGRQISNPVGFYLTLRDDGTIVRVPYDEVLFVYAIQGTNAQSIRLSTAFPDEPGVPYNCLTY